MIKERQRKYRFSSPLNAQAKRHGRDLLKQRKQCSTAKGNRVEHTHYGSNPDLKWYSSSVIDHNRENLHTNRVK